MTAYYNEINPFAAQTLRNLIAAGEIAPGVVDERSIELITPHELREFTQCHFFAGIGIWSLALRQAGIPDTQKLWTGSCPCQPFSNAGEGKGFADERHLWPYWQFLIEQSEVPVVLGEQVSSKDAEPWLDLVQDDLEAMGYAFGALAFPAASVGAPNRRERVYWMAHTNVEGLEGWGQRKLQCEAQRSPWSGGVAVRGRDGIERFIEPGVFPLATGDTSRMERIHAYGNALNAEACKVFIQESWNALYDINDEL